MSEGFLMGKKAAGASTITYVKDAGYFNLGSGETVTIVKPAGYSGDQILGFLINYRTSHSSSSNNHRVTYFGFKDGSGFGWNQGAEYVENEPGSYILHLESGNYSFTSSGDLIIVNDKTTMRIYGTVYNLIWIVSDRGI